MKPVGNCALISLPHATHQGYERESGLFVAPDPAARIEDAAACVGTIVSCKERLFVETPAGKVWIEGLKEGDKVAVDYRVVSKGEWMGDVFKHENAHLHDGKPLWKAEPYSLIARRIPDGYSIDIGVLECPDPSSLALDRLANETGSGVTKYPGHWQALGEHVLLEKIVEVEDAYKNTTLILPEIMQKEKRGYGKLVSGLDFPAGTEIMFDPRFGSVYQFSDGLEYIVVMRDYVFGVINNN